MKLNMQIFSTVTAAALMGLIVSGSAWAGSSDTKGSVNVTNCLIPDGKGITVNSYNPKDLVDMVPFNAKSFSEGETKSLRCDGQGKEKCTLELVLSVNKNVFKTWKTDVDFGKCWFIKSVDYNAGKLNASVASSQPAC